MKMTKSFQVARSRHERSLRNLCRNAIKHYG